MPNCWFRWQLLPVAWRQPYPPKGHHYVPELMFHFDRKATRWGRRVRDANEAAENTPSPLLSKASGKFSAQENGFPRAHSLFKVEAEWNKRHFCVTFIDFAGSLRNSCHTGKDFPPLHFRWNWGRKRNRKKFVCCDPPGSKEKGLRWPWFVRADVLAA